MCGGVVALTYGMTYDGVIFRGKTSDASKMLQVLTVGHLVAKTPFDIRGQAPREHLWRT